LPRPEGLGPGGAPEIGRGDRDELSKPGGEGEGELATAGTLPPQRQALRAEARRA
jgi:hypothetical protein